MTHERNDEQLQAMLAELNIEKAPASLTRRLQRIPAEQGYKPRRWRWPRIESPFSRWVMVPALAAVPLLVISLSLLQPGQPSAAEVEQARQDLAIAFSYLDRVGHRTGTEIHDVLEEEFRHGVKQPLSEHMPFTESFHKEESI